MQTKSYCLAAMAATAISVAGMSQAESMRLEWVIQGQFAGPIVALEKGYFKDAGIDMSLHPAGPDLKPTTMVATGVDTFGIGHPHQVIAARSNDVPLVTVSQWGQKSATTYVTRKDSGIESLADMPGHSVGLWFGGDEHEFLAMLKNAGIKQNDVKIISQGYDIISWLNGDYDVMQVARYNELLLVYANGYPPEKLNFLHAEDAGVSFVSGGLFTTEKQIAENPEMVQAVVSASLRGWKEAFEDPEAAADIVMKYNTELEHDFQVTQIKAMNDIACAGPSLEGKFGEAEMSDWETVQGILLEAGLIDNKTDLSKGFTNQFVDAAPAEYRDIPCS
ncbi:MAG: ABC transporter substrate-binding protein [Paracoccaceae bacterium]|jgi:NitT/TauT family transport system substrate-binding protein|nr:ABC transporter substrate-binding protein [Paracoccaceae bacterium]